VGGPIEPHIITLVVASTVGYSVVPSFIQSLASFRCWQAWLWMACNWSTKFAAWCGLSLVGGCPKEQVGGQSRVLFWTLDYSGSSPECREWMLCKQAGRWVILHPNLSGAMWWLFIGAPRPFTCSAPPRHPIASAGVWCLSSSLPDIANPPVSDGTWSLCSSCSTPKRQKKLVTSASATVEASWLGFQPHGKIVHSDQEVLVSLVTLWEGPCYIDGYPFKQGPTLYIWPQFLV
jgi:hypothetical protein